MVRTPLSFHPQAMQTKIDQRLQSKSELQTQTNSYPITPNTQIIDKLSTRTLCVNSNNKMALNSLCIYFNAIILQSQKNYHTIHHIGGPP
jgi:hypothetical protein